MRWPSSDIFDLYRHGRIVARYRRKFINREGKKTCYFANYGSTHIRDDLDYGETDREFSRKGGKIAKTKPLKLKGPSDIVCRESYRKILSGKLLDYEFLTEFENKLFTRRALGCSWKKLAQDFSGGHDRRSFKAHKIKNIIHDCYDKIRINERSFQSNIPLYIKLRKKK